MKAPWERLNIVLKHADFGTETHIHVEEGILQYLAHTHRELLSNARTHTFLHPHATYPRANEISVLMFLENWRIERGEGEAKRKS